MYNICSIPRSVFEFKKLLHAMAREVYSEKLYSRAAGLVDALVRDKRVLERLKSKRVWYNSRSYVKLDKEAAALAYIVLLKIHMAVYGLSGRPRKLVTVFTAYTGYTLDELREELKKLSGEFYDWFLLQS